MNPFDYIKAINNHEHLEVEEREYALYIVNTAFSMFADTVIQANQVNCLPDINPQQHFDYLYHTVRPRKRFKKWPKRKAKSEDIRAIQHYYKYNYQKAVKALEILSEEKVAAIKNKDNIGG